MDLNARLTVFALDHADSEDELALAVEFIRSLSRADKALLLQRTVADQIWVAWRNRQREIEQQARVKSPPRGTPPRPTPTTGDRWQGLYDNPGPEWLLNSKERKAFRRWCGDRFDAWLERLLATCDDSGEHWWSDRDHVLMDFHPGGWNAFQAIRRAEAVKELIDAEVSHTRLEVTRELLSSMFALGNGIRVSWADATIEQHQQRIDALAKDAAGTIETAAMHQAAIALCMESNVQNLGSLEVVEAA